MLITPRPTPYTVIRETDWEKQLKEEKEIMASISEKKGLSTYLSLPTLAYPSLPTLAYPSLPSPP